MTFYENIECSTILPHIATYRGYAWSNTCNVTSSLFVYIYRELDNYGLVVEEKHVMDDQLKYKHIIKDLVNHTVYALDGLHQRSAL